jgi:hypothetical protein
MRHPRTAIGAIALLAVSFTAHPVLAIDTTDDLQRQAAAFIDMEPPDKAEGRFGPAGMSYADKHKLLGWGIVYQTRNGGGVDRLRAEAPAKIGAALREEIMDRLIMSLHAILVPEPLVGDLVADTGPEGLVRHDMLLTARGLGILAAMDREPALRGRMADALLKGYKPKSGTAGMQTAFAVLRGYSMHYVDDPKRFGDRLKELYEWIVNGTPPIDQPDRLLKAVKPGGVTAGADILHALSAYYVATGDESAIRWGESILQYLIDTYWIETPTGNGFARSAKAKGPDLVNSGEMIQAMYWFDRARFDRVSMPGS